MRALCGNLSPLSCLCDPLSPLSCHFLVFMKPSFMWFACVYFVFRSGWAVVRGARASPGGAQ
jgi:hypothetical protein